MYQYNVWQMVSNCGIGEVMAKGLFDCKWFKWHFFIFTESKDHKKSLSTQFRCPICFEERIQHAAWQHWAPARKVHQCGVCPGSTDHITTFRREWSCSGITHTFWRNTKIPKSYWWLSTPFSILKACRENSQFIVPTYQWPRPANGKF